MISRTKPMPASARHLAAAVTLSCAVGFTANAQVEKEERHVLEEIVVTATLRETNLQETPVAVTALTEQKLLDNFINSVDDVALVTPNVTVAGRRTRLATT
jgi:iron complex outermembrane receptor protein